jgi:hypothetical protein
MTRSLRPERPGSHSEIDPWHFCDKWPNPVWVRGYAKEPPDPLASNGFVRLSGEVQAGVRWLDCGFHGIG